MHKIIIFILHYYYFYYSKDSRILREYENGIMEINVKEEEYFTLKSFCYRRNIEFQFVSPTLFDLSGGKTISNWEFNSKKQW